MVNAYKIQVLGSAKRLWVSWYIDEMIVKACIYGIKIIRVQSRATTKNISQQG